MAGGGSKPGERRGGRKHETPNRASTARGGPALTEEGLGHIVVADPANGFGRACGLPEAAAEGLALHQRARGHKGAMATRPAGALRRRADAVATDQLRAVEVETVPSGADRAAGVDSRPLERD